MKFSVILIILFHITVVSFSQYDIVKFMLDDSIENIYELIIKEAKEENNLIKVTNEVVSLTEHYKRKSEFTKAVRILSVYMSKLSKNDTYNRALCLLQLGELNRAIEEYEEALIFLQDGLRLFKSVNDIKGIGETQNRLAAVYFEMKEFEMANRFVDSSMISTRYIGDGRLMAGNIEILGAIHHVKKEYKKAIALFLDVIHIYQQLKIEPDANVYINLCITYLFMNDYKQSIYYGEKGYKIAKKQGVLIYIENICRFLSEAYSKLGNFEKAYQYQTEGYSASMQLFTERKNIEILEINRRYESENIIFQIENQRYKIEQTNKLNYLFIILFIFLSSGILFSVLIGRRLKRSNLLLHLKNQEITKQREQIEEQADKIKQKAADLMVLNMQLKELDAMKEGLTGMLVHDLKNPISNILSISKNKEVHSYANQMLVLVNNILDVQKYESAKMKLEIHDYSLTSILLDAINQVSILAEHKNIIISVNTHTDIHVSVDFEIIQRVIVNVLTNSIKYTPHNGKIEISYVIDQMNERFVEISVKDNGIGIKKDKLNTIFNKFNQIIAKNSGPARSTGLGLTFCKLAVEAHEGEIMVESEQGVYTIFKFTLPKSDEVYFRSSTEIKSSVFYEIFLNYEEKKYLERIVGELSKTDVYDIGNLRKLTLMIDDSKSIHIEKWKKELQRSIYNCNLEYYNELIKIASITQNE